MNTLNFDKPQYKNTANLLDPIVGHSDALADELREKILTAKSGKQHSGRSWYISNSGSDNNDGKSSKTPWATLKALQEHEAEICFGDNVLLECGGVYRGRIIAKSGVYYGSYGNGDKPCIYVSRCNYATREWKQTEPYVWEMDLPDCVHDAGIVVFNHGEAVGTKKHFEEKMDTDLDFTYKEYKLSLYSTWNPSERFNSIEIGDLTHIIQLAPKTTDVTIDNLTLKYGGGMAVQVGDGVENIEIRNCEIGWIGGSYLIGYKDGKVRFGNGIEFWGGCKNIMVENCWVYQIYDSGLSHQGSMSFIVDNLTFKNNLVEYTSFASIEFWADFQKGSIMQNINYEGNILRFAGYGWGEIKRPFTHAFHILATGDSHHKCVNFYVKNNIMELAKRDLLKCRSVLGTVPILDGNTYIQKKYGTLGGYKDVNTPIYRFDDHASDLIENTFLDKNATVLYF